MIEFRIISISIWPTVTILKVKYLKMIELWTYRLLKIQIIIIDDILMTVMRIKIFFRWFILHS